MLKFKYFFEFLRAFIKIFNPKLSVKCYSLLKIRVHKAPLKLWKK
jgi:hypothetical protein